MKKLISLLIVCSLAAGVVNAQELKYAYSTDASG